MYRYQQNVMPIIYIGKSREICTSIHRAHDSAACIDSVHPKVVYHQVWGRSEGAKLTVYHEFWFGTVDPHENGKSSDQLPEV